MNVIESLWGEEFNIPTSDEKDKVKKISKKVKETKQLTPEEQEKLALKQAKSKSIPFAEKLKIITAEVHKVLGKQVNNVVVIKDRKSFHDYVSTCIDQGVITVDTETNNSTNSCNCMIVGLCLYTDNTKQAYIPINHRDPETKERLPWQLTEQDVKEELQRAIDAHIEFDLHNGPFDYQVISTTCHINIPINWDTMIAARVINENELAGLKSQYTTKLDPEQEKYSIEKLFDGLEYADVPPELFALYAATDSLMTRKLKLYQEEVLQLPDVESINPILRDIELPVVSVCAKMEQRGIRVDMDMVKRLSAKYHNLLDKCDKNIENELINMTPVINAWKLSADANAKPKKYATEKDYKDVKLESKFPELESGSNKRFKYGKSKAEQLTDPINLASPTQLAIVFYDILKCESVSKKSPRGTGEDELTALDKKYNIPLCKLMLERRGIVKLLSTYIDNIPELVKLWPDGKIRTHFKQYGADTGRFASGGSIKFYQDGKNIEVSGVNLQNIPAHEKSLRMIYCADPGKILVGSDYSAQEVRMAAYLSNDKSMIQAYIDGKDLYSFIASNMYGNKYEDNLEFWPEGTEIDIDGKRIICGKKTHLNKEGKARRQSAKAVLIGLLYGRGVSSIAEQLSKPIAYAQDIVDRFFKAYPTVKQWIADTQQFARDHGYVEGLLGRRRRLPDIQLPKYSVNYVSGDNVNDGEFNPFLNCENKKDETLLNKYKDILSKVKPSRSAKQEVEEIKRRALFEGVEIHDNSGFIAQAERQAVNAVVQGSSATLTKKAMIDIENDPELNRLGFELLIPVHDEVIGQCPEENAEAVAKRLPEVMINAAKELGITVPMSCDPSIVHHWYEDEYENAIQTEYKHYLDDGIEPETAIDKIIVDHTESLSEYLRNCINNIQ